MLVDYSEHFWGEKHVGYNTLYENLKRGEDSVQELSSFVKDRISIEEDIFKSLNKSLIRVNQYINNNGAFVDSWRLTKGTIELYCDIQASVLKNLIDLSKDVIKYHDDLVKSRKRVKTQDVVDAVNLMQTTTTCLQKAKETYQQRCAELLAMKNETQSKEVLKMKSKVAKAHEEYKSYVEKYAHVRDNFEEKMLKSTKAFQAHDTAHLQQMKTFFTQFGRALDDAHGSITQVTGDYRNSLQQIDIENIMVRFVEEKGTGTDKPEPIKWTESDELLDDISSNITSQPSSSNSSAIVVNTASNQHQNVTNFIDLDSPTWTPTASPLEITKTGDSDIAEPTNNATSSNLTQFSSSLGRQKLAQWLPRRKKNSSQSSLSGTTTTTVADDPTAAAPSSFGESNKGGFLKRYRKVKNSINDLTATTENNKEMLNIDDNKSTASSAKSDEKAMNFLDGLRSNNINDDSTPTTTNAPLVDDEGFIIRTEETKPEKNQWSSCTSSDDEDEIEFQASKIRQLQIKPVNESNTNINASVDELRNAIGHISLQRSTTFDKDPWSTVSGPAEFSQSLNISAKPLRAAFTGDEHLRRKRSAADADFAASFNQPIGNGNTIARARPRSNTPTALTASAFGLNASMSGMSTITSNSRSTSTTSSDVFGESKTEAAAIQKTGFADSFANFNSSSASTPTFTNQTTPKRPIAMAVNEFAHAWFKASDPNNPVVKVFGTVVISFPSILFPLLTDVTPELEAVKFSLEKAGQIQTIIPNKRLLLPTPLPTTPSETYNFTIDKLALANFLLDQKKQKPDANFYNVDIVRYELKSEFVPPLILRSYWKIGPEETGIRVDYNLNEISENTIIDKPLLNITFTTKLEGENIELTNSSPPATFDSENGTLTWLITELTKHGEPSGSLKARLKLSNAVPSSTHVMFQATDINFSTLSISMNSEACYNLSMTKRKIIAGKYFCEPEVRN